MSRLGPSIVRRPQLEEWLGRFSSVPVRFLIAPPGFGKTMALLGYLRHVASNGFYCALRPCADAPSVLVAIGEALQVEGAIASHEELIRTLAVRAPLELAIDCHDIPSAEGIDAIIKLIDDLPEEVSLLIACRSRAAFKVGHFVSEGTASL